MARVFISFVHEDKDVAESVKYLVTKELQLKDDNVFISSDLNQVSPGDPWIEKIRAALEQCEVLVSILSLRAIRRPWINFEAGAVWIRRRHVIPVCVGNMSKGSLPQPYSSMHAVAVPADADDLLRGVAKQLGLDSFKPRLRLNESIASAEVALKGERKKERFNIFDNDPYKRLKFYIESWDDEPKQ